jgi:hypothetical protein
MQSTIATGTTISAPLFPVLNDEVNGGLYDYEGENYPSTKAEQIDITKKYHKTFGSLFNDCKGLVDGILSGDKLTNEQIVNNYNIVAECSSIYFGSKPYYIPKLVDDVDICAEVMGANFRMLTESDLQTFDNNFYKDLNQVLATASGSSDWWAGFYFSLATYIRANDGSLKIGNLYSDVEGGRVIDIEGDETFHLEDTFMNVGNGVVNSVPVVLRCILSI